MSNLTSRSNIATSRRNELKGVMDNFSTFTWQNLDSYENFGCFIINEGSDLKWVNGPNYSNEYANPLYSSGNSTLLGIDFKTWSIDFRVGVYWVTLDEYRKFLYWLSPFVISKLLFNYDQNHYYNAKVSALSEASKRPIGSNGTEQCYYAELSITFEIQGQACAWNINPDIWRDTTENTTTGNSTTDNIYRLWYNQFSDLRTSISIITNPNGNDDLKISSGDVLKGLIYSTYKLDNVENDNAKKELFSIQFKNINDIPFNITYNSFDGSVLMNDTNEILTLRTTSSNGSNIIESFLANKVLLPSKFEDEKLVRINIELQLNTNIVSSGCYSVISYGKTNII